MEKKEIKAVAKEVTRLLLKQVRTDEVKPLDYKGLDFTPAQKKALVYWLQPETKVKGKKYTIGGWKLVRNGIKVEKSWTNVEGISKTQEFEGVELEKEGKVIAPLFVNNSSILKVWN